MPHKSCPHIIRKEIISACAKKSIQICESCGSSRCYNPKNKEIVDIRESWSNWELTPNQAA